MPALRTGALAPGYVDAGQPGVRASIAVNGESVRVDASTGQRFVPLSWDASILNDLSDSARSVLRRIDARVVALDQDPEIANVRLSAFLETRNSTHMLVRPDFCVYGSATGLVALESLFRALDTQILAPAQSPARAVSIDTLC